MGIREIRWGDTDWIHLVQDRDQWKAVVSTVMNLWVCCLVDLHVCIEDRVWTQYVNHKESVFNFTYFTKLKLTYVYSEALHFQFCRQYTKHSVPLAWCTHRTDTKNHFSVPIGRKHSQQFEMKRAHYNGHWNTSLKHFQKWNIFKDRWCFGSIFH
jgi:hypothetical protein